MPDAIAAAEAFAHVTADLSGRDVKLSRRKPKTDGLPPRVVLKVQGAAADSADRP